MLTSLFSSKVRIKILTLFFARPEERFYLREVERLIGEDFKGISQELRNLEQIGLVESERQGNLKYYRLRKDFFLYPELRSIIFKTTGAGGMIQEALSPVKGIQVAFIYGSVARGEETAKSDIDLMVIGDLPMERVLAVLRKAEKQLGRTINLSLYGMKEFMEERKKKNPFILEVTKSPKVMLMGNEDELERNEKKKPIRDHDLANVEAALLRAAKKARVIAEQTHTPLIFFENGRVVKKFVGKKRNKG